MSARVFSVAMASEIDDQLRRHLLRADGQEDLCLATYAPSTGQIRDSALLRDVVLPEVGERVLHGTVSFTGAYVLRVARLAAQNGLGVALIHSHPGGCGWQSMSHDDADAEASYSRLALQVTGRPLVGMTLAGRDGTWSARSWPSRAPRHAVSVRVVGVALRISWNDALKPPPSRRPSQVRTVSSWGPAVQSTVARLRVLVVGAGSVGLDVGIRLAASGVQHVAFMDFDTVGVHNLDRMIGATPVDAYLATPKTLVAVREAGRAATAAEPEIHGLGLDVATPNGQLLALDYDLIFSCVDRPLPRSVLSQLAYAHLIPVIDGGIAIDVTESGAMRDATWRSHVLVPGRPCLLCSRQVTTSGIQLDREGRLEDPAYLLAAGVPVIGNQNVAVLSASVAASLLTLFVSLTATPNGRGVPPPLQYSLGGHLLLHREELTQPHCATETGLARGDEVRLLNREPASALPPRTSRRGLLWALSTMLETAARRLRRYAQTKLGG